MDVVVQRCIAERAYWVPVRSTTCMLAALIVAVTGGCSILSSDEAADHAEEFLHALAEGDVDRAAALTDKPESAAETLRQAHSALDPEAMDVTIEDVTEDAGGRSSTVDYELAWHMDRNRTWRQQAQAQVLADGDGWTVRWTPAVLHPDHGAEHTLAVEETTPDLAPILGRDGQELLAPRRVTSILLDPAELGESADLGSVASTLASELQQFDEAITRESILDGAREVDDGEPYLVAALREDDFATVQGTLDELEGVEFTWRVRMLGPTRDFGAHVLPGIHSAVEERLEGEPGWRVVALDAAGAETAEFHAEAPEPSDAVDTTLSYQTQSTAEATIEGVSDPTALVAMEGSTGDILAVAQNSAAAGHGPIAATGHYPPGSTFKIVTAAAGLTAGELTASSNVECPGSTVIDNRSITNEDEFALAEIDLTTAFARSCNTTFAHIAAGLDNDVLTETARSFGLGAEFRIPGLEATTGSVPPEEGTVARAENGFGQGTVVASPFGMALVASAVSAGEVPAPGLIEGEETEVDGVGEPLPAEVTASVREMMRAVVTDGTANELSSLDGVHGKTGTAQVGDEQAHGWFTGYQGDLAFAVLVIGSGDSSHAVEVAGRFLTELE